MKTPSEPKPPLLIAGAFLSASTGIRFVCEDLADGLAARGWPVTTTSHIKARPLRVCDMLATVWLKRSRYRLAQIDVYSGAAFYWAEAVSASLRALHCPYVLTLHDGNLPAFATRHPDRVRRLLESAAAVTSPSGFLQREFGQYRRDIRVIRNGLHIDRYPSRAITRARPRLVWIRAFEDCYNPGLALDVVKALTPKFPEITLTMIGPDRGGVSAQDVAETAREQGLGDRVSVRGAVPKTQVAQALQEGDIFLNTTNVDNAPVIVVEAMACGLCVVSTNAGGVPDLVVDGKEGLLVPCGDAEAMAIAVTNILNDPSLATRLSAGARGKAVEYSWTKVLDDWEDLFAEIAEVG